MQHFQIDHYIDAEIPVMINRRFLHQHSRHIDDKHLSMALVYSPGKNKFIQYLLPQAALSRDISAWLAEGEINVLKAARTD